MSTTQSGFNSTSTGAFKAFTVTGGFTAPDPGKPVVLVVDDTPFNIDVLRGVLSSNYTLKVATNGEKALSLARAHPQPELVLLDVMMPGMDGYEVCRRLKAGEDTRHIPVVFVTSMSEVEDEKKGFESGGVDYITKPVSPPLVQARVATQLRLYAHERQLTSLVKARTQEESERLEGKMMEDEWGLLIPYDAARVDEIAAKRAINEEKLKAQIAAEAEAAKRELGVQASN